MKKKLTRSSMRTKGIKGIDITYRRKLCVSPPRDLVLGYKAGAITEENYTEVYLKQLNDNAEDIITWAWCICGEIIKFKCFCPEGAFCHTHLLIDWLIEKRPDLFQDGRTVKP